MMLRPAFTQRARAHWPRFVLPVIGLLSLLAAGACREPNLGMGDRCTGPGDCQAPLVCSNRDATDLLGICVLPEALPDAALPDAAPPDAVVPDAALVDAALDGEIPLPYGAPP